jgi:hypothetical protein
MNSSDLSWLHVSDFHMGMDGFGQRNIFSRIISEVCDRKKSVRPPDFVFISGDVANTGQLEEFAAFNTDFVAPLVTLLGDEYLERVFLVPGNHDVDRTKGRAVRRYDVLTEVPNLLDPTAEGLAERAALLTRFKSFDEFNWTLENTRWVGSPDGFFAKRFAISGLDVGILCINTAWFCGSTGEQLRLTPGRAMIEKGIEALQDCNPLFVVGHHPFEWWVPADSKLMRSLLSKQGAIYLCGHLHKSEHFSVSSGPAPVISLQAGCGFIARNDEQWATRIIWGGFNAASKTLLAQPKKWIPDHSQWAIDSDAIPDNLRVANADYWAIPTVYSQISSPETPAAKHSKDRDVTPPDGWVALDEKFVKERAKEQSDERMLQYFDGSVPTWDDIFADRIPERAIVAELVTALTEGFATDHPQVTLMLGAGGEGKSTAFFQVLRALLLKGDYKILWRSNPEQRLLPDFARSLANRDETWLFASDEADTLIGDVYSTLRALPQNHKIHFFLTCRDTDWIESDGAGYAWAQLATFIQRNIKGLTQNDAEKIVAAWTRYGIRGLGRLAGLESHEAVQKLLDAATLEASTPDGAFLGAMLRVRIGMALRDHVAALLGRLESREIQGIPGKTLLDAFAYIAVPHACNLLFLSKSVLAKALGLDETRIRRRILGPLGEEAAASAYGQSILTRHRAIAEVAVDIMSTRFHFDAEDILIELVRAAIQSGVEGGLVPHLRDWRYLSTRMFDQGNQALGVNLATAALESDPGNSFLAVKLSQLYREAGQPDQSVSVFRNSIQKAQGNRAFFTEWGTCEGHIGNDAASVWLKALSIADGTEMRPPTSKIYISDLLGLRLASGSCMSATRI